MKIKDSVKPLIGVLCILVLVLAVAVAVILDSRSPEPILGIFQPEPTLSTEETEVPTEGTNDPTAGVKDPTQGTTNPTEGAKDPTEGTTNPTQGTTNPTQGTTNPTQGTTNPTEGTTNPTEGATDPTEGAKDPTEGAKDPTEGVKDPTEGVKDPTEGAKDPTEGAKDPTEGAIDPTEGNDNPTDPSDGPITPPEEMPPSVVIPPEKDPETGESLGITFPCQISEYGLVIEKMAPYSGMFVEDGSNINTENVAMLLVHNNGDFPIEYIEIRVSFGQEELLFDISALPVGEKLVVQEKTGKSVPDGKADSANAMVVQRADMEMSESKVRVVDNGNNTLTIQNLTNETIPAIRVFYKYYMKEEGLFVGGIAFAVRITRLGAGSSVTIQPSHYTSQTSRVVMVLTYDSEV